MRMFFPQWQGAGARSPGLQAGAESLLPLLPDPAGWHRVPVVPPDGPPLAAENGIQGYRPLLDQFAAAQAVLGTGADSIVTLGGDCAVDLAPLGHLAARHGRRMALVWIDAHGDLNTPATSPSGALHGMPVRLLLGDGDPGFLARLPGRVDPDRVILAGTRDLDPGERQVIADRAIRLVTVAALRADPGALAAAVLATGAEAAHLHLDLDVLDPGAFAETGFHVPGGLTIGELVAVLEALGAALPIVGGALTEYLPPPGAPPGPGIRTVLQAWLAAVL